MGEYVRLAGAGDVTKLGTCEDLFYWSFWRLREVLPTAEQVPGNCVPMEYLDAAQGWRYRFPWPDEPEGYGHNDMRAMALETPAGFMGPSDWDHVPVRWFIQPTTAAPGVSVGTDCPQAAEVAWVEVYEQKQVDGALWLIIRCPYCQALARVPREQAAALVAHARTLRAADKFTMTVCDRIMAGYEGIP